MQTAVSVFRGLRQLALLGIFSCAGHPDASPVSRVAPTPEQIAATDLFPIPFEQTTGKFEVTAGRHSGKHIRYQLSRDASRWRLSYEGLRRIWLEKAVDGSILITREDELDDGVYTIWDPPRPMLPSRLETRRPVDTTHTITVYRLATDTMHDTGTCQQRIEWLGRKMVTTPAGTFDAYIVQTTWMIDMKLASAKVVAEAAYARDKGIVFMDIQRQVKVLGVWPTHQAEQMQLVPSCGS